MAPPWVRCPPPVSSEHLATSAIEHSNNWWQGHKYNVARIQIHRCTDVDCDGGGVVGIMGGEGGARRGCFGSRSVEVGGEAELGLGVAGV